MISNYDLAVQIARMAKIAYVMDPIKNFGKISEYERGLLWYAGSNETAEFYDELFCAFYSGAITAEQLVGGVSE